MQGKLGGKGGLGGVLSGRPNTAKIVPTFSSKARSNSAVPLSTPSKYGKTGANSRQMRATPKSSAIQKKEIDLKHNVPLRAAKVITKSPSKSFNP